MGGGRDCVEGLVRGLMAPEGSEVEGGGVV